MSDETSQSCDDEGRDREDGYQDDDREKLGQESAGVGEDLLSCGGERGIAGSDVWKSTKKVRFGVDGERREEESRTFGESREKTTLRCDVEEAKRARHD